MENVSAFAGSRMVSHYGDPERAFSGYTLLQAPGQASAQRQYPDHRGVGRSHFGGDRRARNGVLAPIGRDRVVSMPDAAYGAVDEGALCVAVEESLPLGMGG